MGAGLSGLTIANAIGNHAEVTVFEKARALVEECLHDTPTNFILIMVHSFFTARNKHFKQFLEPHFSSGLVQEWKGKVVTLKKARR